MSIFAVFLIILTVLLVVGLFIITYVLGRLSIKDNPQKALVFVKTGSHISKPKKAKLNATSTEGSSFTYENSVLFVPSRYEEIYHREKRMLFVDHKGQLIASPFSNRDILLSNDEKETLIYELVAGHIGADGMRAIKGKQTTSVIIIAVAAFVIGIIATYGFIKFQEARTQQVVQQTQQQSDINITPH